MAITNIEKNIGLFKAAEDLSNSQYHVVQLNSLNQGDVMWQKPSSQGTPQGVLVNNPKAGQVCSVQVFGIAKALLGGSSYIQAGRGVGVLDDGRIVEGGSFATTVSDGNPGDIISILLGGSGSSIDNFAFEKIIEGRQIKVPLNQQLSLHLLQDENFEVEGELLLDGSLILEC